MDIPYEMWEKIALSNLDAFNILVRAIPKLGRKTINDSKFQDYVISNFNLIKNKYIEPYGNRTDIVVNRNYHSIYDRPATSWYNGCKIWWKNGIWHRDNDKPAIIESDGTKKWFQNGRLLKIEY